MEKCDIHIVVCSLTGHELPETFDVDEKKKTEKKRNEGVRLNRALFAVKGQLMQPQAAYCRGMIYARGAD